MGFFSRKNKEEKKEDKIPNLLEPPKLPELPKLSELSNLNESEESLPPLPSFPRNTIGERFSKNTIKEAVNGKKEEEEEIEEDDFAERMQMIPESPKREFKREKNPLKKPLIEDFEEDIRKYEPQNKIMKREILEEIEELEKKKSDRDSVFVRIDKFEESRKIFERTKEQIFEIERALNRLKSIKKQEDAELNSWEQEILDIRQKISKVEKDIFSKAQ